VNGTSRSTLSDAEVGSGRPGRQLDAVELRPGHHRLVQPNDDGASLIPELVGLRADALFRDDVGGSRATATGARRSRE
jgi:hypothetical protein